jgi:hypothetical protein
MVEIEDNLFIFIVLEFIKWNLIHISMLQLSIWKILIIISFDVLFFKWNTLYVWSYFTIWTVKVEGLHCSL